jgi:hypothetical protein
MIAAAGLRRSQGSAAVETRAMPVTLMSRTRAHSSSLLSATVPDAPIPALLTTMSIRPNRSPLRRIGGPPCP